MAFSKQKRRATGSTSSEDKPSRRPRQSATSYTLWLLGQRDYSASELRKKLAFKEYTPEEIEAALAYVQENHYQDDTRYARVKAEAKARKLGNRRIRQTLAEKGIEAEVISAQLEQMDPETERVISAVSRFEGKPLTPEQRQKVFRFLAYRGFSSAATKAAFSHLEEILRQE